MEESTALWLLGIAHSEYEAARSELDSTYGWRKTMARDLDAARKEADALRVEREAAYGDLAEALRERDAAQAELETLKASTVPTGWIKIGNWAHAHPDGMLVRKGSFGCWVAEDANGTWTRVTAIDAARAAGRFDFPGSAEPTP